MDREQLEQRQAWLVGFMKSPPRPRKYFWGEIRRGMKANGQTMADLAEILGVSRYRLRQIFSGAKFATVPQLQAIAEAQGRTLWELLAAAREAHEAEERDSRSRLRVV